MLPPASLWEERRLPYRHGAVLQQTKCVPEVLLKLVIYSGKAIAPASGQQNGEHAAMRKLASLAWKHCQLPRGRSCWNVGGTVQRLQKQKYSDENMTKFWLATRINTVKSHFHMAPIISAGSDGSLKGQFNWYLFAQVLRN